jgi:AcrR family transcriptional regulator
MPYEVVKRVNGREYRYRVERYRDPATGKSRARWTYLGPVRDGLPRKRAAGGQTRDRLVDAVSELVEEMPWSDITADRIAARAKLAHGTLYRHFRDRWDVLRAAVARRRADLERERPRFDGPIQDRESERERLRGWVLSVVSLPLERPGLAHAYDELLKEHETDAAERRERGASAQAALTAYLQSLAGAGLIAPPRDVAGLSRALLIALKAVYGAAAADGSPSKDEAARAVAELFDRAVFGASPAAAA